MKKNALLASFLSLAVCIAAAQTPSSLAVEVQPLLSLPMGADAALYDLGAGASLFGRYSPPRLGFLGVEAGGSFSLVPVQVAPGKPVAQATMSLLWPWAAARLGYSPSSWLELSARVSAGYFFASLDAPVTEKTASNPIFAAGLGADFRLSKTLSLGFGAEYRDFLGLYTDLALKLGTSYHVQPPRAAGATKYRLYSDLVIEKVELNPVFPVLFKYYGDHPVGSVLVKNKGKIPIENLRVEFFVNQYMDNPTLSAEIPFLKGGQELRLDLLALFNDKVLGISEATKVQANLVLLSSVAGEQYGAERVETLRVYDRNAVSWSDDRRVAAFVSAKDPDVMRFAKNVASLIKDKGPPAFTDPLLSAAALHGALGSYGLSYQVDPSTPYTQFSKNETAIDYLQFPGQSLQFRAGDCDDLSILNASLLEALGIQTAFITVPGHIYIAFDLGLPAAEAVKRVQRPNDLIVRGDTAWVPVEITLTKESFLKAWETGAEEWRQAGSSAQLLPVHDAWALYEPVGFAITGGGTAMPADATLLNVFQQELERLIEREFTPQESLLKAQVQKGQGDPKFLNSLGVLYARYGFSDRAETQFGAVLAKREYFPSLVNLANLRFLAGRMGAARDLYARASKAQPGSALATLGLARTSYELADYAAAARYYGTLKGQSPGLAEKYAYLAAGSEAAAATRGAEAESAGRDLPWSE